jgi:NADH-quinone oxidoreductase subunit F
MGALRGDLFPKNPAAQIDFRQNYDELDCRLDFDDPKNYDLLGLGTAAAVVVPEHVDIRDVLVNITRFYAMESCGQCTQCREGTAWMYRIAQRIAAGAGRLVDLDILVETTQSMGMMPGMSICGLPDGAAWPIRNLVQKFRREFEERIRQQDPTAVLRRIKDVNPAAYELPVLEGRAREHSGGTFQSPETLEHGTVVKTTEV